MASGRIIAGLAPEKDREHSIRDQLSALNVGFMEHLHTVEITHLALQQLYDAVQQAYEAMFAAGDELAEEVAAAVNRTERTVQN